MDYGYLHAIRVFVSFGDDEKTAMFSTTRQQGLVTPPWWGPT
jgi:hypothetical protein